MSNPTGASGAMPPPYPFPGWHGHPEDNVPPQGYIWEWMQEDARWRLGGDGKWCRFTIGPGHATCKRPAVATLDRAWSGRRSNRWGYCEDHLFSRHIHDGAIWSGRLLPVASGEQGTSDCPAPTAPTGR